MRKLVSLCLAALLLMGGISITSASAEPVTLTLAIADRTNVEDFATNEVTLWVEETLGVNLEFHVYESGDYNTKVNLMVASGDKLEDIIIGSFSDAMVYSWAKEDALAPLTQYYADAATAPNLYEAMERVGTDFRGAITMPDGEIYYIPVLNQSYGNEFPGKVWIYEPWLETLGMEAPVTTAEFEALLKAAVSTDLNGNGISDEVGLAGFGGINGSWFAYLMNAFVYTDYANSFLKVDEDVLSYSFETDEWRAGVEWIASLVGSGLIPTETVTQDNATWQTMINTTEPTALTFGYLTPSSVTDPARKSSYVAMKPLIGPEGLQLAQYNPSKASCGMLVTVDCKNPDQAFAVGDLLVCEENSIITRFGARGVDWDYLTDMENPEAYTSPYEGFDVYIVVYDDGGFWGSGTTQNRSWMQSGPYIRQYGISNGMGVNPDTVDTYSVNQAAGICLYQQGDYFPAEAIVKLIYNDEETQVVNDVSATLKTYVEETTANWIMGNAPLNDSTWATFQSTVDSLGAQDMLACAQAAYDRSVGKE